VGLAPKRIGITRCDRPAEGRGTVAATEDPREVLCDFRSELQFTPFIYPPTSFGRESCIHMTLCRIIFSDK